MKAVRYRRAPDFLYLSERDLLEPVRRYLVTLGWPLLITKDGVFMPSNQGIVAITVASNVGEMVNAEFLRTDVETPILSIPGPNGSRRWAFLTEEPTVYGVMLPPRVDMISGSKGIPLPPTENSHGAVEWAVVPNGLARIPSFARTMCTIRHVAHKRSS